MIRNSIKKRVGCIRFDNFVLYIFLVLVIPLLILINTKEVIAATHPTIIWEDPTPADGATVTVDAVYLNTTITDTTNTSSFFDFNNSLIAYWSMETVNTSNLFDNSTYKHTSTFSGGAGSLKVHSGGKYGNALKFDGVDDTVNVTDSDDLDFGTSDFSIDVWFRQNNTVPNRGLIDHRDDSGDNQGWDLILIGSDDKLRLMIDNGTTNIALKSNTSITDTTNWHNVVYTIDRDSTTGGKVYVDGALQVDTYDVTSVNSNISGTGDLIIGTRTTDALTWNGSIDEIKLHKRVLTPEEVNASYNNGIYRLFNNFTNLVDGDYNYSAYTIDSSGNLNISTRNVTVNDAPVIQNYNLNYTNYWLRDNQTLLLNITNCTDDGGATTYNWTLDESLVSSNQSFTLNGSNYDITNHTVVGYCYDGGSASDSISFNIELINKSDFTLIQLPDTQNYSATFPGIFTNQTLWVKDILGRLNVKIVTHMGDVVDDGDNDVNQWVNANTSLTILDGVVPYGLVVGNHDYDLEAFGTRALTFWNNYFNYTRYNSNDWWGGEYVNDTVNSYQYFNESGFKFMLVNLEFCPRDEVLEWANETIQNNSDKKVIISTHNYLYHDGTKVDTDDDFDCSFYSVGGNNGESQWEKLVKHNDNIFLVLSGHMIGDGTGYLRSRGANNTIVHQILANYQDPIEGYEGGNGYLRIMRFIPSENRVSVKAYSPFLDNFLTANDQQFDFEYYLNGTISISPNISFIDPTPANETSIDKDNVFLNTTIIDSRQNTSAFFDWNYTLIAYWPMDYYNASGVFDNSSNSNFANFDGAVEEHEIISGKFGNALALGGTDGDNLNVTDDALFDLNNSFSISAWAYLNATPTENKSIGVVSKGLGGETAANNHNYLLGYGNNALGGTGFVFTLENSTGTNCDANTDDNESLNTWYHLVGIFDNDRNMSQLYVNGNLKANISCDLVPNTNDIALLIGDDGIGTSFGDPFNGSIDEVAIFSRILSAQEINASFNNSLHQLYNNFTNLEEDASYTYTSYAIDTNGNLNITPQRILTVNEVESTTTTSTGSGKKSIKLSPEELESGYNTKLKLNGKLTFEDYKGIEHVLTLTKIEDKLVTLTITSNPLEISMLESQTMNVNLDGDDFYDLEITVYDVSDIHIYLNLRLIREHIDREFFSGAVIVEKDEETQISSSPKKEIVETSKLLSIIPLVLIILLYSFLTIIFSMFVIKYWNKSKKKK